MARIRSLKPEIVHDARLARCSIAARYLYVLLITQADDYGRLHGATGAVRGACLPNDDLSLAFIDGCLDELGDVGLIVRYDDGGQPYIALAGWAKNQKVDKPGQERIPAPQECQQTDAFAGPSRDTRETPATVPPLEEGSGRTDMGGGKSEVGSSSRPPSATADLDLIECEHLANLIEANGSKRPTITAAWLQAADRMKRLDGREHGAILKAIEWCQADEFWRGNILSMPKLREQYDRLRLAAGRAGRAPSTRDDQRSAASDYRRRVAAGEEG